MLQGAPLQILRNDVRAAFVFDRNELQKKRMVELKTDSLLTLKTVKEVRVAFELEVRYFHGHGSVAVLLVFRFENRSHSATAEHFSDPEAAIQQLAWLEGQSRRVHRVMVLRHFLAAVDLVEWTCLFAFHRLKFARNRAKR
jgi:hypothetical protein